MQTVTQNIGHTLYRQRRNYAQISIRHSAERSALVRWAGPNLRLQPNVI